MVSLKALVRFCRPAVIAFSLAVVSLPAAVQAQNGVLKVSSFPSGANVSPWATARC
jgi:hypothetical protein